ncbi:hypothetical protein [Paenibacillus sp. GCM10027626]|uniref:hypothetical protein n=1 Tax=Paenibacillus sp. GCM10027626 TaxID=3273411 RepID=UPI00362BF575
MHSIEDLINQKIAIAKRAGELHGEIKSLRKMIEWTESKKTAVVRDGKKLPESITVRVPVTHNETFVLHSNEWDREGTRLHDMVLQLVKSLLADRESELNDLIKVMQ